MSSGPNGSNPYGGHRRPRLVSSPGPVPVPSLAKDEREALLEDLHCWTVALASRFAFDPRTLPPCWEQHNAMVEALAALRDYERACFDVDASPASGIDWIRSVREISGFLKDHAAQTGCSATNHRELVREYR